jgi:predicted small secreted protein
MRMKLKDFLAGVLTGVAAGVVVSETIDRVNQNVSADSVLNTIKDAFKNEGPIDGSWIVMKTEPFTNNVITMDVYRGGISRIKEGELEQFEFAADAKTGTVVELIKA